ncbi:putative transporter [Vanrija pseudolonga]|nr:purtative transporter [Vanrija pseudolonga]WOO83088.1 purtative transporter [Vanrija pseudolonga]
MTYSSDSKEEAIGSIDAAVPADFAGDNGDYRFTPEQVAAYEIDPDVHKRVVRAYDKRILPTILLMYLFSALDRGNVSNAKSDHMDLDLGFKGNEWNTMLTVFYVPFCVMAYPGTFMSKKFGAHRTMPIYMAGWGVMALVTAAVKNYHQTLVVRLILGMFEGCFGASLNMYLACFYKRDELGKRMATWYSTVAISGAFSGLLSYGLFQVKSRLHGWQLLFLVEGSLTVLFAVVAWFALPPLPTKSTFLTPHERTVAVMRLLKDATTEVDAEFNLKAYFEPAKEWQTWAWAFYCLIYGVANQTASVFLTQIIGRFGFSKVKTNLYTVPPYACAVVVLWCVVISSDYHRERTCHTMFANLLVVIGTITLACVPVNHIAPGYFCTFLITSGSFIPSVLFLSFVQNNTTKENSRAFRAAVMNFGANAGGIVSSNIFLQQFAPKYVTPLIVSAAIAALGICVLICLRTYMVLDNRRRNREQGVTWTSKDVPTAALSNGPSDPQYRWFY